MRFHINPTTGEAGACRATRACPFGSQEDHYPSLEAARAAYEGSRSSFGVSVVETPHSLPLDGDTQELLSTLFDEGLTPLVVGGAVRDSLLSGTVPKDVDVEVHGAASMDQLAEVLKAHGYVLDEVGKSFGVFKTVLKNGMDIDISLPRRDSLVGEGHRGFEVEVDSTLTLSEAAARRDFTINALYYDARRGVILDAHRGLRDWESGTLRHVSDAFREDPLRVLRAVQFASRFNLTLAPETAQEARAIADTYPTLSTERVQEEWAKLFLKGKSMRAGLQTLQATGWASHFGLEGLDPATTGDRVQASMDAASEAGLDRAAWGAGALAMELPEEKRMAFLRTAVVGERPANKMHRLGLVAEPVGVSARELRRWGRNELKDAGSTVEEWDALHGPGMAPAARLRLLSEAQAAGTWSAPAPDLITGQAILDAAGTKRGGRWVGVLQREAARAQDDEVFTDEKSASEWLRRRVEALDPEDMV